MRVLLAIDGSASSEAARQLVGSIDWPDGSCVRVVAVVEPSAMPLTTLSPLVVRADADTATAAALQATLNAAAEALTAPGRGVEAHLLRGRAASRIVEEAEAFRAELIVLGSRGLGTLRSMLLGSVSAEVVDHAPCAVLVSRSETIGRILLAVDGSTTSQLATDHLGGTGYLKGHPVEVITVQPRRSIPVPAMAGGLESIVPLMAAEESDAELREQTEATAAAAARQLIADGFEARWSTCAGDPAHEIVEAAAALGCSLIVLGSRGLTGLDRVLLGSVARNVLLHTPASVLIVREPLRQRLPERRTVPAVRRATAAVAG